MKFSLGYLQWWLKYRPGALWRAFTDFIFDNGFKKLYTFLLNDGVRYSDSWSMDSALSRKFLIMSYEFGKKTNGYPSNISTIEEWQDIISKIRFAHFWVLQEEIFNAWMIESQEERFYFWIWTRKVYPWCKDFLSWRFFKNMISDEHCDYDISIEKIKEKDEDLYEMKFVYKNRISGRMSNNPPKNYNSYDFQAECEKKYNDGMELFVKYYRNLWY
jgi:hypothetical protein